LAGSQSIGCGGRDLDVAGWIWRRKLNFYGGFERVSEKAADFCGSLMVLLW
jgi:hypothetical protein